MQGIKYFIAITHREFAEQYIEALNEIGVKAILKKLCKGTATDDIINYLDLEKTEKVMIEGMVYSDKVKEIKNCLVEKLDIYTPGNGIAMFLPIDGIGGNFSKSFFLGDEEDKKENKMVEKQSDSVLIITVCNKGNTDIVMDAARGAGASGGTVVRAQGTGAELAKFFGVTISQEKEMVYIVSKREDRDKIMYAIMEKAGKDSPAYGVVFSMPVDSVLGIRSLENL